jgi:hypothetical protein
MNFWFCPKDGGCRVPKERWGYGVGTRHDQFLVLSERWWMPCPKRAMGVWCRDTARSIFGFVRKMVDAVSLHIDGGAIKDGRGRDKARSIFGFVRKMVDAVSQKSDGGMV